MESREEVKKLARGDKKTMTSTATAIFHVA